MTLNLPDPDTRERAVMEFLQTLGIETQSYAHEPAFTVAESQALRGTLPGGHAKNLFLKDKKGGLWLVVAPEALRVDLNALSRALKAPRFSFGSAELLMETLGVPPGSVTPLSLMNDTNGLVTAVFDAGLLEQVTLNFHPLRNDRTISISPGDLLAFARATGHEPVVVALPERPEQS